jgi:hypothetical protein
VQGSGTAAVPLDQATGYDGSPLISSAYKDPDSLNAIASTVRNTVGRNTPAVTGSRLAGRHPAQKYVRPGGVLPNVVYAPDAAAAPTRPYVPGADPVFTADLSSGKPVYTAGTYDPTRPSSLQAAGVGELGSVWHDIEDFKANVIHGAEKVAKIAWKFADEAVTAVIHTAEAEYDLAISDLEDAVTAVAGFFKSVVDDIKKAIEWLSALFNFENILKNHTYIKNAITNPTDPSNPGILDRLGGPITQALEEFLTTARATLEQDFKDLPGQIKQALESVVDSFKDPKSLLSTALSDLMTVFQHLADDLVNFAQDLADDLLNLIDTLLKQVVIWVTEPVSIPFVSDLYHALTGDPLSVLDLACLLAPVPGTILLDVITGSPTVPDTVSAAREGALPRCELAGRILLGITTFCLGEVGVVLDLLLMDFRISQPNSWYTGLPPTTKPP